VVGAEDKVKGQVALAVAVLTRAEAAATPEGKKAQEKGFFSAVDGRWGTANPARALSINLLRGIKHALPG